MSTKQEDDLKALVGAMRPRSTRQIGAFIEKEFGLVYESRFGLIALLHRLGLEYHKPDVIPRKRAEANQKAVIESYDKLLNCLGDNEAVGVADAGIQPMPRGPPAAGHRAKRTPRSNKRAGVNASTFTNIHGAIDL